MFHTAMKKDHQEEYELRRLSVKFQSGKLYGAALCILGKLRAFIENV